MVRMGGSAIAENVDRDLAFAASRLTARSHPGAGGCAAPSSLVIFGSSQPNARSTVGCSSPPGQRYNRFPRTRHDRAHICRGDDGRGTLRSRATACSRRASPHGKKDSFVAGMRASRSGLPRVFVHVLADMHTGAPGRYCSCTRSVRSTQPAPARRRRTRIVCGRPLFQETPHLYRKLTGMPPFLDWYKVPRRICGVKH